MPDTTIPTTQTQTTPVAQTTAKAGDIVVDKNKTPEQYIKDAEAKYIVPRLVRDKFADLIKLIFETESMNVEEREYWLQIMPIMSEEQIVKFRDILINEKQELEKLDKEYNSQMSKAKQPVKDIDEAAMKAKIETIKKQEASAETTEKTEEANLLNQLDNL